MLRSSQTHAGIVCCLQPACLLQLGCESLVTVPAWPLPPVSSHCQDCVEAPLEQCMIALQLMVWSMQVGSKVCVTRACVDSVSLPAQNATSHAACQQAVLGFWQFFWQFMQCDLTREEAKWSTTLRPTGYCHTMSEDSSLRPTLKPRVWLCMVG